MSPIKPTCLSRGVSEAEYLLQNAQGATLLFDDPGGSRRHYLELDFHLDTMMWRESGTESDPVTAPPYR
jgi:hypothetical protein